MRRLALALIVASLAAPPLHAQDTSALISPSPEGAAVYFISPQDGEVVAKTFRVRFGLSSMGVAPAGIDFPNAGHHHLLINVGELPDLTLPVPADDNHVHFGLGQTEAEVTLPAGEHRLQLLLGNHLHIPHDPPVMSEVITATVE
ncbi:MAG: DUF4399 domain-containing protein [Gammaproteobacteria bacterium]|nr:DUF4399 domain-containing protein [Gammaproteobacteria bacterium]